MLIGTLGKALRLLRRFHRRHAAAHRVSVQKARSYIYTTALPQPVAAATRDALELAQREGWRRERVLRAHRALPRAAQLAAGVPLSASVTPIQPVLLGSASGRARGAARARGGGFWVVRDPPADRAARAARGCASRCRPRTPKRDVDALAAALGAPVAARAAGAA